MKDFVLKSGRVVSIPETLKEKLECIHSIEELEGFANRRRVLGIIDESVAPRWTEEEKQLIIERKFQLMKKGKR